MPIYEYICPQCRNTFELRRPFSECDAITECPTCKAEADRIISAFSHVTATPADHFLRSKDKAQEKMWLSERKMEDYKIKDPDPLARWREERQEACGKGPEAWVEWAKEESARKEKEADEQRTKETAENDYAAWATKSTSADPQEKERYLALKELQKIDAQEAHFQEKRKWNPITEAWEDEKPAFDYPPVFKPKGEMKESRFERKKPEVLEDEDEIPEGEQYL